MQLLPEKQSMMTSCVYESSMWLWLQIENCKQCTSCFFFLRNAALAVLVVGETSAFFRQATCSTKSTSSTSSARASSLHPHPSACPFQQQPWPYSGQRLWQNSWAGQQFFMRETNTFLNIHQKIHFGGCICFGLDVAFGKGFGSFQMPKACAFFPSRPRLFHFENCRSFLWILACRPFHFSFRIFLASQGNHWFRNTAANRNNASLTQKSQVDFRARHFFLHWHVFCLLRQGIATILAFCRQSCHYLLTCRLVCSTAGSRPFLWKTLLHRQSGLLHPLQAAKQVFDPHSCQGTIFHVSAFPENIFSDCSAFVYCCVHRTLGHARESSYESLPFFILAGMFSFHQPHSQEGSIPFPNFFFTA